MPAELFSTDLDVKGTISGLVLVDRQAGLDLPLSQQSLRTRQFENLNYLNNSLG